MSIEEFPGAVIGSDYVTNDPNKIEAAMVRQQHVRYVSRDHARFMALCEQRREWDVLAGAPALLVIVDGVRYRRNRSDSPISFPTSAPAVVALPGVAG